MIGAAPISRTAVAAALRSGCSSAITLEMKPRLPYAHSRTACSDGISAAAARSMMRDSRSAVCRLAIQVFYDWADARLGESAGAPDGWRPIVMA